MFEYVHLSKTTTSCTADDRIEIPTNGKFTVLLKHNNKRCTITYSGNILKNEIIPTNTA